VEGGRPIAAKSKVAAIATMSAGMFGGQIATQHLTPMLRRCTVTAHHLMPRGLGRAILPVKAGRSCKLQLQLRANHA